MVDAAAAAKVGRFIPSEFGSYTRHPRAGQLPVYADKVAVQEHLDATKNRTVYIREADVTQNELLRLSGKQVPTVKPVSTEQLEKEAFAELGNPNPNPQVFALNFLRRAIFGDGYGDAFPAENLSNDLLGVRTLSEVEIGHIVLKCAGN